MRKFKILAALIVATPLVWFGWWWMAAGAKEAAIEAWLEERRAAGWQAEAAEIGVTGFPNRLDAVIEAPALADPASGWAWRAPELTIAQVAYAPTFFVVEWPPEQSIAAPGARAALRTEEMRASLKVAAATSLAVERTSLDIVRASVEAEAGWTAAAERLTAHLREAPDAGPDNAYQFRIDALKIRPPEFLRRMADPAGALPATVEAVIADGRIALDRPIDRFALEGPKPALLALSLRAAEAVWGELRLAVDGAAKADEEGFAEGEFDIVATNWREMLDAAVAAEAMPESFAETLKSGLGFVARLGGDPDRLDVTLKLSGGFMRIGPVPIGPAPRMIIR